MRHVLRVLLLAPDFPPAYGGIQTALGRLAAHLTGVELIVLAPAAPGAEVFDRAQPYRVVRTPALWRDGWRLRCGWAEGSVEGTAVPSAMIHMGWGRGGPIAPVIGATWGAGAVRETPLQAKSAASPGAKGGGHLGGVPAQLLRYGLAPALSLARTCDVVWCGHAFAVPLAYALSRLCRRPYVIHAYAVELAYGGWAGAGLGWLCRRAARCLAISRYAAEALRRLGTSAERIVVAPLGVDPPAVWPPLAPRVAAALAGGGPMLLSVGRLVRRKGHDLVLRALPALRCHWPTLRYLVAGDGPEAEPLRALAERLAVGDAVRFLGTVSAAELAACYHACDVFVLPAREQAGDAEGFGLVYVEANAYGKPVIAARSGGVADAVADGVSGLLIPPEDVGTLAQALRRVLDAPALAAQLGAQGRERARAEFGWAAAATRVRAALEAACASAVARGD